MKGYFRLFGSRFKYDHLLFMFIGWVWFVKPFKPELSAPAMLTAAAMIIYDSPLVTGPARFINKSLTVRAFVKNNRRFMYEGQGKYIAGDKQALNLYSRHEMIMFQGKDYIMFNTMQRYQYMDYIENYVKDNSEKELLYYDMEMFVHLLEENPKDLAHLMAVMI